MEPALTSESARSGWGGDLAIAVLTAAALVFACPEWLLPDGRHADSWRYIGLFEHWADPSYLMFEYKLMRLPWILLGAAGRAVLPMLPLGGESVALLLGSVVALGVATGGLVRATVGPSAGRLAVVLVVGCPWAWQPDVGPAYPNAFALAALAAAAWAAVRASSAAGWIGVGALLGIALLDNIILINLVPALALPVWAAREDRPTVAHVALLATGVVAVFVAGTIPTWAVGREPLYLGPLLTMTAGYLADPSRNVQAHGLMGEWWAWAGWLGPLALTLPLAPRAGAWGRALGLGALVWLGWQAVGQTALDWARFAYPLLLPSVAVLATVLSRQLPETRPRVAMAALLVVWVAAGAIGAAMGLWPRDLGGPGTLAMVVGGLAGVGVAVASLRTSTMAWVASVLMLGTAQVGWSWGTGGSFAQRLEAGVGVTLVHALARDQRAVAVVTGPDDGDIAAPCLPADVAGPVRHILRVPGEPTHYGVVLEVRQATGGRGPSALPLPCGLEVVAR